MNTPGKRVLVVPRDATVAILCREALLAHGHHVNLARTAAEAITLLPALPDVIILDLGKPTDFSDFVRLRGAIEAPILVLAGGGRQAPIVGADACVRKPFGGEDLVRAVESVAATGNLHPHWRDRWEPLSVHTIIQRARARPAGRPS